jgi:uncharacterized protein (TIGR03118 family)
MKHCISPKKYWSSGSACILLALLTLSINSCRKIFPPEHALKHFDQENLVDNNHHYQAAHTDPTLLNAWGIAFNTTGVAWVNSQGAHVSEVYDKEGAILRPPVWIPGAVAKVPGNPTGIVFNESNDFWLSNGKPARFLFVGLDGVLSGWNPDAGNNALVIKNNSATSVYTGLAIAKSGGNNYIYAADFRSGKIVAWDKNFHNIAWTFKDPQLPAGYSPFNIQASGDWLYVMYAKVGPEGDEEKGAGNGYVSVFETNGNFVKRLVSKGALNAPWGMALAPAEFFKDNEDDMFDKMKSNIPGMADEDLLLVGNFGDGRINAYTKDGSFVGPLKSHGKPITIEGLWAIRFPPATATAIDPNRLYFAAGPNEEKDGLFGYILKQ